jgi:predicted nucleic acid-binding protein
MGSEDASILAAAIAAQPDYLVTGDRRFFENAEIINRTGLRIVTPA